MEDLRKEKPLEFIDGLATSLLDEVQELEGTARLFVTMNNHNAEEVAEIEVADVVSLMRIFMCKLHQIHEDLETIAAAADEANIARSKVIHDRGSAAKKGR